MTDRDPRIDAAARALAAHQLRLDMWERVDDHCREYFRERARVAIEAADAAAWRDIATAPTDAAPVIVWDCICEEPVIAARRDGKWRLVEGGGLIAFATHWQPLLQPPSASVSSDAAPSPAKVSAA